MGVHWIRRGCKHEPYNWIDSPYLSNLKLSDNDNDSKIAGFIGSARAELKAVA